MARKENALTVYKFPAYRRELIKLAEEDQNELKEKIPKYAKIKSEQLKRKKFRELSRNCHLRAKRMAEILEEVKVPSVENIGLDGNEAVALLAMHSYLDLMRMVLDIFQTQFLIDPTSISASNIPALADRIHVLERRKQKFGTQWMVDANGRPFLIELEDFDNANALRAKYGLGPIKMPVNVGIGETKHPLGKGLASKKVQKQLTDEEYVKYSENYLRPMV